MRIFFRVFLVCHIFIHEKPQPFQKNFLLERARRQPLLRIILICKIILQFYFQRKYNNLTISCQVRRIGARRMPNASSGEDIRRDERAVQRCRRRVPLSFYLPFTILAPAALACSSFSGNTELCRSAFASGSNIVQSYLE